MSSDYFTYARRQGNQANPGTPGTPGGGPSTRPATLEGLRAPSSIRIRRLPSGLSTPRPPSQQGGQAPVAVSTGATGRRRSSSEPQRYGAGLEPPPTNLGRQRTQEESRMTPLAEETPGIAARSAPSEGSGSYYEAAETPPVDDADFGTERPADRVLTGASAVEDAGNAARANRGLQRFRTAASAISRNEQPSTSEYNSDVVDLLDLVGM